MKYVLRKDYLKPNFKNQSIIFGLIFIIFYSLIPHLFAYFSYDYSNYFGFVLDNDQIGYFAQINSIINGDYLGQWNLAEEKNIPFFIYEPLPRWLYALFFFFINDIKYSYIVISLIFGILIYYSIINLLINIGKSVNFSVFFSVYTIVFGSFPFGDGLIGFYDLIINFSQEKLYLGIQSYNSMKFYRIIPPLLVLPILIYSISILAKIYISKNLNYLTYFFSLFLIVSAYSYIYIFLILLVISILVILTNPSFLKQKNLYFCFILILFFLIPWMYNFYNIKLDYNHWFSGFSGQYVFVLDHTLLIPASISLILLIFYKLNKNRSSLFIIILLFSDLILRHQGNITNITIDETHFKNIYSFIIWNLGVFEIFRIILKIFNINFENKTISTFLLVGTFLTYSIIELNFLKIREGFTGSNTIIPKYRAEISTINNSTRELIEFINLNIKEKKTFIAEDKLLNNLILATTKQNIFIPNRFFSLVKDKEILSRLLHYYKLIHLSEKDLSKKLKDDSFFHRIYFNKLNNKNFKKEKKTKEILNKYSSIKIDKSFLKKVDYLIVNNFENKNPHGHKGDFRNSYIINKSFFKHKQIIIDQKIIYKNIKYTIYKLK